MAGSIGQAQVTPPSITKVTIDATENTVVVAPAQTLVGVSTEGPKEFINTTLDALTNVQTTDKVNGSVLYYDGNSDTYKVDSSATILKITDGGNF